MVKMRRRIKPLRKLPIPIRLRDAVCPSARFNYYGSYTAKTGVRKRISFKIENEEGVSRKVMYRRVRNLMNMFKQGIVPMVPNGTVFRSYKEAMITFRSLWRKVRNLRMYRGGKEYEE
jgi:hypothetical protein